MEEILEKTDEGGVFEGEVVAEEIVAEVFLVAGECVGWYGKDDLGVVEFDAEFGSSEGYEGGEVAVGEDAVEEGVLVDVALDEGVGLGFGIDAGEEIEVESSAEIGGSFDDEVVGVGVWFEFEVDGSLIGLGIVASYG